MPIVHLVNSSSVPNCHIQHHGEVSFVQGWRWKRIVFFVHDVTFESSCCVPWRLWAFISNATKKTRIYIRLPKVYSPQLFLARSYIRRPISSLVETQKFSIFQLLWILPQLTVTSLPIASVQAWQLGYLFPWHSVLVSTLSTIHQQITVNSTRQLSSIFIQGCICLENTQEKVNVQPSLLCRHDSMVTSFRDVPCWFPLCQQYTSR